MSEYLGVESAGNPYEPPHSARRFWTFNVVAVLCVFCLFLLAMLPDDVRNRINGSDLSAISALNAGQRLQLSEVCAALELRNMQRPLVATECVTRFSDGTYIRKEGM